MVGPARPATCVVAVWLVCFGPIGTSEAGLVVGWGDDESGQASPPPGDPPPVNNARGKGGDDVTPKPIDVLSKDSLAAIASIGKTPDEYYQRQGYKGGWKEFWEKRGKEYFSEPAVT